MFCVEVLVTSSLILHPHTGRLLVSSTLDVLSAVVPGANSRISWRLLDVNQQSKTRKIR